MLGMSTFARTQHHLMVKLSDLPNVALLTIYESGGRADEPAAKRCTKYTLWKPKINSRYREESCATAIWTSFIRLTRI